jgi:RNA polymerase sigma factor (sigma-70 family)
VVSSRNGDRDAFTRIVERYQSLICALTYGACGDLHASEDLAQVTFITAWCELPKLQEPSKLKSWLCGIARNVANSSFRQQRHTPTANAQGLDETADIPSEAPSPRDHVITREEEAIMWRALGELPPMYREPLALFYRQHQSTAEVAEVLGLSEDAVSQRLSRGRAMLTERVAHFVETTLSNTGPTNAFTVGVLAALPGFAISAKGALLGATAAKGSAAAKASILLVWVGTILGPLMGILGAWIGVKTKLHNAQSERERQYLIRSAWIGLVLVTVSCMAVMTTIFIPTTYWKSQPMLITGLLITLGVGYVVGLFILSVCQNRRLRQIRAEEVLAGRESASLRQAIQPREYRSRWSFLGLPLLHFRQGRAANGKPTISKGWIALGGDVAIGAFACAPVAVGGIAIGGAAFGLAPIGGIGLGLLTFAGFSIGWWAVGGLAVGYYAFGGSAIAWFEARGGAAIAHHFAVGGAAFAEHANDAVACSVIRNDPFLHLLGTFMSYATLLLIMPSVLILWQVVRIRKAPWKKSSGQS